MPVKLPSSTQSSAESSPSKTMSAQNSTESTTTTTDGATPISNSSPTSSSTTTSSDNFMTATASVTSPTNNSTTTITDTTTTTVDNYETSDDVTLKPMDFEDFKRSVHQDYVNGANSFQEPSDDTLKRNQPIDPSRINDSLKFYGDNPMSKSFNCEHALRSIDPSLLKDTLNMKSGTIHSAQRIYALQKSGSATNSTGGNNHLPHYGGRQIFEKGINRSKSGPSCFDYSDSDDDDDSTLKPQRTATVRRSDIPLRYVNIQMNCYPKEDGGGAGDKCGSECESSRNEAPSITNSGAIGGDELTQTEDLITANSDIVGEDIGGQPLHVTEDGVVLRRPPRTGAAAIKRRSGNRR